MINLTDYNDFFLFLGGLLIVGGIVYFLFHLSLQNVFISEEEISKLKTTNQASNHDISFPRVSRNMGLQVSLLTKILLAVIIGGFLFNQVLMWRMNSSNFLSKLFNINITITKK